MTLRFPIQIQKGIQKGGTLKEQISLYIDAVSLHVITSCMKDIVNQHDCDEPFKECTAAIQTHLGLNCDLGAGSFVQQLR